MGKNHQERQVLIGAALFTLVVIGLITWGLWRQIDRIHDLRAAEAELVPLVAYERAKNRALLEELERVSSPTYPEEWARVYGGMTRGGETLVVMPPFEPSAPAPAPAAPEPAPSFWQSLRRRFSGGD